MTTPQHQGLTMAYYSSHYDIAHGAGLGSTSGAASGATNTMNIQPSATVALVIDCPSVIPPGQKKARKTDGGYDEATLHINKWLELRKFPTFDDLTD